MNDRGFVTLLLAINSVGFILTSDADAFSLSDHTLITERATEELSHCIPNAFSEADSKTLVNSNLWEDMNLLNKWVRYSHYFRPGETLDLFWRSDASARVTSLNSSLTLEAMGGILHYIQDVSSPPHVIPVTHNWNDGFESYVLSDSRGIQPKAREEECQSLIHSQEIYSDGFLPMLTSTAFATLQSLTELKVRGLSDQGEQLFLASDFWQEGEADLNGRSRHFGQYGELGNEFGKANVIKNGITYSIPFAEYDRVKTSFLRQAIEASKKALSIWYHQSQKR